MAQSDNLGHAGSWSIGGQALPDYHITETLANLIGRPSNNLVPDTVQKAADVVAQTINPYEAFVNMDYNKQGSALGTSTGSSSGPMSTTNKATTSSGNNNSNSSSGGAPSGWRPGMPIPTGYGVNSNGQLYNLDINAGGGNGGADISSLYQPALDVLNNQLDQLNSNQVADEANLTNDVNNRITKTNTEQNQLLTDNQTAKDKYMAGIKSALQDAITAYNALNQQRMARFGFGSSAGGAVGELAKQAFFKQQGNIQQQQATGELDFANQAGKIKSYISQKLSDLDQYKSEAMLALKKDFQDRLNEIASRKADVEANKTKDKMALLQSTMDNARNIAENDRQFRQQLALAATSKLQEVSGRAFTPQEFQAIFSQYMNMSIGGGVPQGNAYTVPTYNPNVKSKDELNQLNPYSTTG